jgi:predicted SAM-dependent methyltransferase
MKLLNLGCGSVFSKEDNWTNIDFISSSNDVISHNLTKGIPFPNESYDVVYHSHVLEHFSKDEAIAFLKECYRVLKPNGVMRIAVPDLEGIITEYQKIIQMGLNNPDDLIIQEKYNWIILELFDQMTRNYNGGEMGEFLVKDNLKILDYITERVGYEAINYRNWRFSLKNKKQVVSKNESAKSFFLFKKREKISTTSNYERIGKFRMSGEVHQWMYDRYSIQQLLKSINFSDITILSAFDSNIPKWKQYELDVTEEKVRKPDSLFVETKKKYLIT